MIYDVEQGTHEWEALRRGKLTASEAGEWLVAEPKLTLTIPEIKAELKERDIDFKPSENKPSLEKKLPKEVVEANQGLPKEVTRARRSAMVRMLAEELTSFPLSRFTGNRYTDYGNEFEAEACEDFELRTGIETRKVGFVTLDSFDHFGCSPDRYCYRDGVAVGLLEAKCLPVLHVETVINGVVPADKRLQIHFQMVCTGFDRAWFYAYSPDMEPLMKEVEADEYTERVKRGLIKLEADYKEFRAEHLPKLKPDAA